MEFKPNAWFSRIETHEQAVKVIADASAAFFVVALIQVIVSFFGQRSLLIDAFVFAAGGWVLRKYRSRVAAVVLLILSILVACITVANMAGKNLGGGGNIVVAVFMLYAAVRAVQATFWMRKLPQQP